MTKQLAKLLERLKGHTMSSAEIEAQRVSFVYGNAPGDDRGTRKTVRKSLELEEAE